MRASDTCGLIGGLPQLVELILGSGTTSSSPEHSAKITTLPNLSTTVYRFRVIGTKFNDNCWPPFAAFCSSVSDISFSFVGGVA